MQKNAPILIFDFDGTIADTHHYIVKISNRLANEFGYTEILPEEVSGLKDKTVQEVIRHLNVPFLKIPAIVARAKKEFQKDIKDLNPIQNLKEALEHIKAAGVQIGILSSNASENIQVFLEHHDLNIFDFICSTTNIWGKHISLNKVIQQKGLQKDRIVYIGDEMRDINAAKKLGVKIAAVTWGYNSAQSLKNLNPDYLCDDPEDLFTLITSINAPTT